MSGHIFYAYSVHAVVIDPRIGSARLSNGFRLGRDRVRFEVADDTRQTATVLTADGLRLARGYFETAWVGWYKKPDGGTISIAAVTVEGQVAGYLPSEPMQGGHSYLGIEETEAEARPDESVAYSGPDDGRGKALCFGPGTMISTDKGDIPVEWLEASDRVLTRDHGFQPILWLGRTRMARGYFDAHPEETPVRIPASALGDNCPTHDLYLTGDHRVLIQSALAELQFFSAEVLAPAKAYVDAGYAQWHLPKGHYTVTHILCESHQLVVAQGAWVESMFAGVETLRRLSAQDRTSVENLLGAELYLQQTARPCLRRIEARTLLLKRAGVASRREKEIAA